ncbi:MAG TPA: transcription antitermination factor NusB [Planctomycetaceae bacterium]|nr:transcription antitermination factor NusB [Planctomycetaceae bacterium]
MARRSKSRELALQMLFQVDLNPDVGGQTVREQIAERLDDQELRDLAWRLFAGTMEWRGMLDERIQSVAENWTLARMAPTDRNVLRLGAFELLQTDTPYQVVIDEAVELARTFGTAQSPQFVNGILDRLVPERRRPTPGT